MNGASDPIRRWDMTDARQSRIQAFSFVIAVSVCVLLCLFFVWSLIRFGSASGGDDIRLGERINPNDAPIASLVRLPGIGIGRAEAIVAYREYFREREGDGVVFGDCNDLQEVKGIGPKTVQDLREWLRFE